MLAVALVSRLLVTAYVLPPVGLTNVHSKLVPVRAAVRAESLYANDGGDSEVDWDKEAAALAKPANAFYKAVKAIPVQELVSEFADSAPPDVQQAVRFTIAKLLGNMPSEVAAITRVTSDRNIASLMFSMQMTGYMFRNAEYRRSLSESLSADGDRVQTAELPPVSGTVSVEIAQGMKAEVDAAAYMAELRSEVEGLRAQLIVRRLAALPHCRTAAPPHRRTAAPPHHRTTAPPPHRTTAPPHRRAATNPPPPRPRCTQRAKQEQEGAGVGMIQYVQSLTPEEAQKLTSEVSKEVLDAMGQLINSLLKEADVPADAVMETSDLKMRELLVWQARAHAQYVART